MWTELVLTGVDPIGAYRAVFKDQKGYSVVQIVSKILNLLHDKRVRQAIMSYIKQFTNSLKAEISEEELKTMIVEHVKNVKKGTSAELQAIKFVHEIYKEGDKSAFRGTGIESSLGDRAIETSYEEVDPPLLANS